MSGFSNHIFQSNLQRENSTVEKLCQTASKLQKNVEMAQRTNDTHAALQVQNRKF